MRETPDYWRGMALHFESRAQRAEIAQAFAFNRADDEREARLANQELMETCADALKARDVDLIG